MKQYERQREKHEDEELRHALDDDFASIRGLLGAPNRRDDPSRGRLREVPASAASSTVHDSNAISATPTVSSSSLLTFVKPTESAAPVDRNLLAGLLGDDEVEDGDNISSPRPSRGKVDDVLASLARIDKAGPSSVGEGEEEDDADPYDRFVRELAFEKRAAPSDRLKSEAEAAMEAAEALRRSEAARLKRMRGDESDDEDEALNSKSKKSRETRGAAGRRLPQGDDLDDDYGVEGDEVGGYTLGLGTGLEAGSASDTAAEKGDSAEEHSGNDTEDDSEVTDAEGEDSDVSDSESEASAGDLAETEMLADLLHRDAEAKGLGDDDASLRTQRLVSKKLSKGKVPKTSLPYTFPCPEDHDQFLELISGHEAELPTIIERIRTLYHPSLGEGNKQKLAVRDCGRNQVFALLTLCYDPRRTFSASS